MVAARDSDAVEMWIGSFEPLAATRRCSRITHISETAGPVERYWCFRTAPNSAMIGTRWSRHGLFLIDAHTQPTGPDARIARREAPCYGVRRVLTAPNH